MIEAVIALQRIFVSKQVLIRGAVAMGKHFASPELVYSEALVRAFRLERDTARFPRVVVDPNLLDWFLNDADTDAGLRSRVTNVLLRDRDNSRFISYLHGPLLTAHAALLKTYELDRITPSVLEKVQWLAEYHHHIAIGIDKAQTVNTPLLTGFRPFA